MNIGIIADGNGRWGERRGLSREEGHTAGALNMMRVLSYLSNNTDYLVLYGFSAENWHRPKEEVDSLFRIMEHSVNGQYLAWSVSHGARLYHFGRRDGLPVSLLNAIDNAIECTSKGQALQIGFCLNYGAQEEIVSAARRYSEGDFSSYLYTYPFPDIDLVIRTGGEHRLSNFLLYQSSYAEIYFTDTLFPDLDEQELDLILDWFSSRNRTFGK